jgi:hypothetical protein
MVRLNHARVVRGSGECVAGSDFKENDAVRTPGRPWKKGAQRLQSLVDECLEPSLKAKGFASSAIHLHWPDIAGAALAPWSEPVSLKWPPRPPGMDPEKAKDGAVLTIKVEGAFALELQHQVPQILQRVNGFFGWRCVERILIKQGPIRKDGEPKRRSKPVLTAETSRKLDGLIQDVTSPGLKAALARLGVGVMGKR